jgi:hypothetical protein
MAFTGAWCLAMKSYHHMPRSPSITFVIPYIVVGRMMVSSGVLCRGVLLPKTAMVLGAYTARSCAAASSSTLWMPCVLTCINRVTRSSADAGIIPQLTA